MMIEVGGGKTREVVKHPLILIKGKLIVAVATKPKLQHCRYEHAHVRDW
jgi:hypothetical protein